MDDAVENLRNAIDRLIEVVKEELRKPIWWGVPIWKVVLAFYAVSVVLVLVSEALR